MVVIGVVVGAREVINVSGRVVGLKVCESVVIAGELLCAGVWTCVDVHPVLIMHAVSMMINTEQITNFFFIIIDIHLKFRV
jgi:hypothetical protein